jgi:xanthine dehydrogenase YagR molybdenum-binding subunit
MALLEEGVLDRLLGDWVNKDLADYHVPTYADAPLIEVGWVDEDDPDVNAIGTKGIGEIGIVGTAAAVVNAIYHATGVRMRDLPVTPDKLLPGLEPSSG